MIHEIDDQEISLKARFAKHAQDFDDLQNEMAGRDVGRIPRFLSENGRSARASEKKRAERAEALTRLQLLLLRDPAYAALYRETEKTLRDAQTRLDEMLDTVLRAKEEAQERLNGKLSDAARAEEEVRLDTLAELETDIRTGQVGIGDMQLRMNNDDNPPSTKELESFRKDTAEIVERLETRLEAEIFARPDVDQRSDTTPTAVTSIEVPKL